MSTTEQPLSNRPKRADAQRNYDKILAAARSAFASSGAAASLEEIARAAGVGIGTLYRHFPTRQALLEAVYRDEVAEVCRSAADLSGADPWGDLVTWLRRFVVYFATKQALAPELLQYFERSAPVFQESRAALFEAAAPLLERAQAADVVRHDVSVDDVVQLVSGVAKMPSSEPGQIEHILGIALDGLRYRGA